MGFVFEGANGVRSALVQAKDLQSLLIDPPFSDRQTNLFDLDVLIHLVRKLMKIIQ